MADVKKLFKNIDADKISKLTSAPQRYTMGKLAEILGAKADSLDSEKSAVNIVENLAERLDLPDSTATNAAKALGVAGLEVFADPTNVIPIGKATKTISKVLPAGLESLRKLEGAILNGKIKVSPEVAARIKSSINQAIPKNISQVMKDKYETIGKMFAKVEPKDFGKVTVKAETPKIGKVEVRASEPKIGSVKNIQPEGAKSSTIIVSPGKAPVKIEGGTALGSTDNTTAIDDKLLQQIRKGK